MKNLTTLVIATALLTSCGEAATTENKDENKPTKAQEAPAETTAKTETKVEAVEVEETEVADVFDYSKIEHYAVFDTKTKLIENFGAENIVDGSTWYGEGSLELQHSVLTNPNNFHEIKYVWEEENPEYLAMIEVYFKRADGSTQGISSECGVFTTMSLAALKEWNGADFDFSGFGWDFGGGITRKEGSKISACEISFSLDLDTVEDYEKYAKYSGDVPLSTADEGIMEAPISVAQITWFNNSPD